MSNKKILIAIFVTILSNSLFAQKTSGGVALPSEKQSVIKNFDARLIEAERLKTQPIQPTPDTITKNLDYSISPKSISVTYQPPKLRPLSMKAEPLPPSYRGFLKAGYGIPASPYIDASYALTSAKEYDILLQAKHHSANFSSLANQRFGNTSGSVSGNYYLNDKLTLNASVGYDQKNRYFYGYNHTTDTFAKATVKQVFSTIDVAAKLFNSTGTTLNYSGGIEYYNLKDNYAVSEDGFRIPLSMQYWINDRLPIAIKITPDFTSFSDTAKNTLNNIYIQPSIAYHHDVFSIKAGVNLVSNNDEFKIFPNIEATANIAGNQLTAFAGWQGDLQKNTFRSLSTYNPFLQTRGIPLKNTQYSDIYGGVKGNVQVFDYQLQAGYKSTKNLALFLNDSSDFKRFRVLYDDVNMVNVKGSVKVNSIENLELIATLSQNIYSPKTQQKAWHLPSLETNFSGKYLLADKKLRLKAELYFMNGGTYKTESKQVNRLNPLFDLSTGAEYSIGKNFGIFLDINNLLNNKASRWYRYPVYGINILGGITVKF